MVRPAGAAAALLVLLLAGLTALPDRVHDLDRRRAHGKSIEVAEGVPRLAGLAPTTPAFLADVRSRVPQRDRIRLLVTTRGVGPARCDPAPATFYFLSYELLPRPISCDPSPRWWVLYLARDVALPPGSRVVVDRAPGLRLIDTGQRGAS